MKTDLLYIIMMGNFCDALVAYVIMVVADALVPNGHQTISNHHDHNALWATYHVLHI